MNFDKKKVADLPTGNFNAKHRETLHINTTKIYSISYI